MSVRLPSRLFGLDIGIFQQPSSMFVVCWIALVLVVAVLWLISRSHFGTAHRRHPRERGAGRYIGYETVLPRALIYAISAAVGALAGVLFVLYNTFVTPGSLHWSLSGEALVMAVIGGARAVWGPALGSVIFFLLKDAAGDLTEHWPAIIGVILIIVTVMLPNGVSGPADFAGEAEGEGAMTGFALEGIDLTRRYGGFVALDSVSIALVAGRDPRPDRAQRRRQVDADGRAVRPRQRHHQRRRPLPRAATSARCRRAARRRTGLARSFQKTNIFPDLTVLEQVELAARAAEHDNTEEVIDALGLASLADRRAADISYGDQRRLDLALALVGRPSVLLLDEPAAGLSIANRSCWPSC